VGSELNGQRSLSSMCFTQKNYGKAREKTSLAPNYFYSFFHNTIAERCEVIDVINETACIVTSKLNCQTRLKVCKSIGQTSSTSFRACITFLKTQHLQHLLILWASFRWSKQSPHVNMAFIGLVRSQALSLFMGFWSGKQQPKVKLK